MFVFWRHYVIFLIPVLIIQKIKCSFYLSKLNWIILKSLEEYHLLFYRLIDHCENDFLPSYNDRNLKSLQYLFKYVVILKTHHQFNNRLWGDREDNIKCVFQDSLILEILKYNEVDIVDLIWYVNGLLCSKYFSYLEFVGSLFKNIKCLKSSKTYKLFQLV